MNEKSDFRVDVLGWLTFVSIAVALYAVFVYAPTEREMGIVQRIFYFHLGSVLVGFLAILIVFVAGILYLWKGERRWDIVAYSSGEIGAVFCTIVLLTGPIWAKPVWGTWWTWEPRLTSFLILWLIYIAYLMLRASAKEDPRAAKFSAVFGIVGAIDVPIVIMSSRLWRGISPVIFTRKGTGLAPPMLQTLIISLLAFVLLYLYLLIHRVGLETMRDEVEQLKGELGH